MRTADCAASRRTPPEAAVTYPQGATAVSRVFGPKVVEGGITRPPIGGRPTTFDEQRAAEMHPRQRTRAGRRLHPREQRIGAPSERLEQAAVLRIPGRIRTRAIAIARLPVWRRDRAPQNRTAVLH
jgi:hypothetical protein